MEETEYALEGNAVAPNATALDVEFLPLILSHKIHRNLKSSQVEIVANPYYVREPTPEEVEIEGELEPEIVPPQVVYAPPLPALRERKNWWDFYKPEYAFNQPRIRERVELLMTSTIVHITDRRYMVKLQEKIKGDHDRCLKKRMNGRAAEEMLRQKRLLLQGKISFEEVPEELKLHPIYKIHLLAQRIIKRKKAQMKIPDKTWPYLTKPRRIMKAEKGLGGSIYFTESLTSSNAPPSLVCAVDADSIEDVERGLMFTKEDYEKLKYVHPLVKLLREIDGVDDMYKLADSIVGPTNVNTTPSRSKFEALSQGTKKVTKITKKA